MNSSSPRRILIIDDNAAIHADFRKVLIGEGDPASATALADLEAALFADDTNGNVRTAAAPKFEIDSAHQGTEGVEMLKQAIAAGRPYSMAFCDMRMPPGMDGVQTIRELWKIDPTFQVVICTAYSDYSPDQISAELGISEHLLILRKPFEPAEVRQLAAMVSEKWFVRSQRDDLEKMIEARTAELKKAALTDQLTGLPNRLLFNDRLSTALRRSKREKDYRFAVLFCDCDRFKVINDSLGHGAGDQLLLEIAARLQQCVRDVDTVAIPEGPQEQDDPMAARFGGDEFAILLDRIREDADAARVAQRLLNSLGKPYMLNGHEVHNSVSIGITTSSLGYANGEEMIRDADTAMYRAKKAGGSAFVMFDQKMHTEALTSLMIENDLRGAITKGEIILHYQPIIEMRSKRLLGFEALVRWMHPEKGMIPPVDFVPQAEQTGVIVPLGAHVLELACKQLAQWQNDHKGLERLTMSVNVSRRQLTCPDLLKQLVRTIRESGISPDNLKLEITESSIFEDNERSLQVLRQIQDMKVQLHVDDFGTGFSSLSCLHQLPVDGLKLDRQFIEGMGRPDGAAMVRTVVNLAHNLRVPLVAEGVETAEQQATLTSMGCDQAQGYLISKPMDAKTAEEFILRHTIVTATAA